ncbi:MAG: alpha-galactosidase [Oscillospiraceae bacterium]|nr:alpha-galactosidase [Oscillospiraceae bacterium]
MNMSHRRSITYDKGLFHLRTEHSSYLFRVTPQGQLEHLHYGAPVRDADAEALALKRTMPYGDSVLYPGGGAAYCLDVLPLEWSGAGRGDYRPSPVEFVTDSGSWTSDFEYVGHTITPGSTETRCGLPTAYGGDMTLAVLLRDEAAGAELRLYYTTYPDEDVITRRAELVCTGAGLSIRKLMSLSLDLAERDLKMTTFTGSWIREAHRHDAAAEGTLVNESRTGFSSNRANPGFILSERAADERRGRVWGFNLVYSGNHMSCVSADPRGTVRVMSGISPDRFEWRLGTGESFETPEAVMCFSAEGLGGMSRAMHDFVNRHIVRGPWAGRGRPVLVNAWEGFMFDFDARRLLSVAKRAKAMGAELFVMDDGWFVGRDDDTGGLGDYEPDAKKLPEGVSGLAREVKKLGLGFGIWVEPEAVSPKSRLYAAHPDWAITEPGREPVYGRNELLLDLTRGEVRDYIVDSVTKLLDSAEISYVKWDMNRQMAGVGGAYSHRYILGLYEVLHRVFDARPDILFESCSSGGNRFDLGMLCFSPQIWASDDTDPIERLDIQRGFSYLYPLSTMGAHVSASPHAQTLRHTPLGTRFAVSCFGCLGYELDLRELSPVEMREARRQIEFYKKHRMTLQYGRLYRFDLPDGREAFECVARDGAEAVTGHFRRLVHAAPAFEKLPADGLDAAALYEVESLPALLRISDFGGLIKHALPVKLRPGGAILRAADSLTGLRQDTERCTASGAALMDGIRLQNLFSGTGYDKALRLPGDFGSEIYLITRVGKAK